MMRGSKGRPKGAAETPSLAALYGSIQRVGRDMISCCERSFPLNVLCGLQGSTERPIPQPREREPSCGIKTW